MKKQFHSTSDKLEYLFVQFVQALFSYAGKKTAQEIFPMYYYYPYVFFEKNIPEWVLSSPNSFGLEHLRGVWRPSPYYYKQLLAGYEEVEEIKELIKLVAQAFEEAGVLELTQEMVENYISTIDVLESFAIEIVEYYSTLKLSEVQIVERYRYHLKQWKINLWQITIPLFNVTSDILKEFSLASHLRIAPFNAEEKSIVWNRSKNSLWHLVSPPLVHFSVFDQAQIKLTDEMELKDIDSMLPSIKKEVQLILTALRLFKEGYIEASAAYVEERPLPFKRYVYHALMFNGMTFQLGIHRLRLFSHFKPGQYSLSKDDLHRVKKLHEALCLLSSQKQEKIQQRPYGDLTVTLERFNQSYKRESHEDRIIDLTIALESSLLAGLKDELKYRLAIRGAALLVKIWEPQNSQLLLKTIYDVRSAIVHNGMQLGGTNLKKLLRRSLPESMEPEKFTQYCDNIVRDVLRTYVFRLSGSQSLQEVNDDLDKYIIDRFA